jgi:uncharacterized protein DUF6285
VTQDRPEAPELLEAVAEFLFGDVREWAPPEKRFQVLVAANLCAVLARELRAGDEPLEEDLALFYELLGEEHAPTDLSGEELREAVRAAETELSRRLRAGELDERLSELTDRLRDHVRRKLEVARPGYADN